MALSKIALAVLWESGHVMAFDDRGGWANNPPSRIALADRLHTSRSYDYNDWRSVEEATKDLPSDVWYELWLLGMDPIRLPRDIWLRLAQILDRRA